MSDMSHFVVAVISRTPKEVKQLLAPYQENSEGKCPRQYLEFMDAEKIGRREYKNGNIRKIQAPDGQLLSMDDPMFQDTISGIIVPDGYKIVTVPFKDLYPTFENYMEVYHGYKERDHETGRYGPCLHPNGRM